MKTAEILRKLADIVDLASGVEANDDNIADNTGVMVPPLQQKIEIEKKTAGIDNIYDQTQEAVEEEPQEDIETLRKNAGIPKSVCK